jgi:hypothetical protein
MRLPFMNSIVARRRHKRLLMRLPNRPQWKSGGEYLMGAAFPRFRLIEKTIDHWQSMGLAASCLILFHAQPQAQEHRLKPDGVWVHLAFPLGLAALPQSLLAGFSICSPKRLP